MLVLSRRSNQQIVFPNVGITLTVLKIRGQVVKLGIEAPHNIEVLRPEAKERAAGPSSRASELSRHDLKGRLHNLRLALAVFDRQRELGREQEAQQTFQRVINLLTELDSHICGDQPPASALAPTASSRGMRLLVVEDNDNERELLAGLLRLYGYDVTVAKDGVDAWEKLQQETPPDVVLLDMHMPNRGGIEVLHQIRRDRRFSELPVFAVSGTNPENLSESTDGAQFNGWFPKPVDPSRLLSAIRSPRYSRAKI